MECHFYLKLPKVNLQEDVFEPARNEIVEIRLHLRPIRLAIYDVLGEDQREFLNDKN